MSGILQSVGHALQSARPRNDLILAAALAFVLAILLIGRLVFSDFSILDDHQIIAWSGQGLWPRVASTEIVQFGHSARFRPLDYFSLVVESWLFGEHPLPYHLIQIVWFFTFLWAVAWISIRNLGLLVSAAILLFVASGAYWGNIWTHSLFASEQQASFGFGLLLFGIILTCDWYVDGARASLNTSLLLFSVGVLICIGSKENYLPLVALNVVFLAVAWKSRWVTSSTFAVCACLVFLQLVICYGIIIPNLNRQTDIYGGDMRFSHRVLAIFHVKRYLFRSFLAILLGLAVAVLAWFRGSQLTAAEFRRLVVFSILSLWCGIYLLWEQFFYGGQLPTGNRYDFPSQLIDSFLVGAVLYALVRARDYNAAFGRQFSLLALQTCLVLVWIAAGVRSYDQKELFPLYSAVKLSNVHTTLMARDLQQARSLADQHPDWPIIVVASEPFDYEAVVTLPLWLRYSRISNLAIVAVHVSPLSVESKFEGALVSKMKNVARLGQDGYTAAGNIENLSEPQGRCFAVVFQPIATHCQPLPYRPGNYYPVD